MDHCGAIKVMKKIGDIFGLMAVVMVFAAVSCAQTAGRNPQPEKPKPVIADGKYGYHERNVFDFWRPESKKPTPLVIFIHGGGFTTGDKDRISASQVIALLKSGFAVMSINYRLLPEGVLPIPYMDAARAVQYARYNAKTLNIDKGKVGLMGSSAGGLTALFVGFYDDMADPESEDPIGKESTRVSGMAVFSAQTTLDIDVLKTKIGLPVMNHSFAKGRLFGLKPSEVETEAGKKAILRFSPMTYLTKDDPPVWAMYTVPDKPMTDETTVSDAIHHPNFGKVLKEKMDELKIECKLRHRDDGQNVNSDLAAFFQRAFKK